MFKVLCVQSLALLIFISGLAADSILGLYKSSEGTSAQENEIIWHLKLPLQELGYELVMHTSKLVCRMIRKSLLLRRS